MVNRPPINKGMSGQASTGQIRPAAYLLENGEIVACPHDQCSTYKLQA
jgi:hypothetical protein